MSIRKSWIAWALVLCLAIMAGGCTSRGGEEQPAPAPAPAPAPDKPAEPVESGPDYGGTMFIGIIGDATTFNPIHTTDVSSALIAQWTHAAMLYVDPSLARIPEAADKWETSPDGLVWTFHLRDDVRWQDGQPLTAHDVEFTFLAILHPEYTGVRQRDYDTLAGAKEYLDKLAELNKQKGDLGDEAWHEAAFAAYEEFKAGGAIKVLDDLTIQFTLREPFAPMMANMSMRVIPKHLLKDAMGKELKDQEHARNPVGSGPWKLAEWVTAERIVVEANEDYFDGRPYLDRIVVKIIPDQNTLMVALETDEIDVGVLMPEDVDRFAAMPHMNVVEFAQLSYTYLGFDLRNPIFDDLRVRQALTHAIDRETIVAELYLGHGIVAHTHGTPARWDYNPNVTTYEFDVAKAKAILAEAGWADTDGDGVLDKDGLKLSFRLMTNAGNKTRETAAVIIQDQLNEIGVKAEVQLVEWSTFVSNNLIGKDFDAIIVGWRLGTDPDAFTIWHSEGGPFNFVSYNNPKADDLIMKGRRECDPEKRKVIYGELQELLAYELPYNFLFFPNALYGVNKRITGEITHHPHEFYWNVHRWWIPKELQTK